MEPAAIGPARPETGPRPAWGALAAALVNGLLLTVGTDYLPSPSHVTAALCGNAIFAGWCAPNRPNFAASVLTVTGPFLGLHSSAPLAGFVAYSYVRCLWRKPIDFDLPTLALWAAGAIFVFAIGFAYSFPVYWLLVQLGRYANLLLRKLLLLHPTPKRPFTDTQNISPQ